MVMTTGSYPAALSGGGASSHMMNETAADKADDATPAGRPPKSGGSSYDAEYMAGMEKGYNPRKAMAAGIVKC